MELTGEPAVRRQQRLGSWSIVLIVSGVVICLDQAMKWWAWRHVPGALINTAGDPLVGKVLGRLYADRVPGALLDLVDAALLILALWTLVARRPRLPILVAGALVIAGWASNLSDRLGLHFLTAPGSARGAVDFIHLSRYFYNVADLVITIATPLFLLLLTADYLARHSGSLKAALRHRLPTWKLTSIAVGALGLILVVSFGAANDGGYTTTLAPADSSAASIPK